jgi:hypothetical protein
MDDVLLAVDLDRRPVGLHGGDLAAGDAPQQTGAIQVIQGARWVTSEQGQRPSRGRQRAWPSRRGHLRRVLAVVVGRSDRYQERRNVAGGSAKN